LGTNGTLLEFFMDSSNSNSGTCDFDAYSMPFSPFGIFSAASHVGDFFTSLDGMWPSSTSNIIILPSFPSFRRIFFSFFVLSSFIHALLASKANFGGTQLYLWALSSCLSSLKEFAHTN
jgi:hypothetical protein